MEKVCPFTRQLRVSLPFDKTKPANDHDLVLCIILILKEGFQLVEGEIGLMTLPPNKHQLTGTATENDMIPFFFIC